MTTSDGFRCVLLLRSSAAEAALVTPQREVGFHVASWSQALGLLDKDSVLAELLC